MRDDDRTHSGSRGDPRGALIHPAFLAALALLVLNDRVLKGSGLLPAAITGKLSDVAGLVVAPIALSALFGARSRAAQRAVHVVVALAFALTELSQGSADLLATFLRAIGVRGATLVADASDLWALAVLPLPYALLGGGRAPVSRAAPRVSLGLALLACAASPQPPPPRWFTHAYVVNRTGTAADVRIAWTAARPDCAALDTPLTGQPPLSRVVDPAIFGDAITFHLDPGETVPLDETAARAAVGPVRGAPRDAGRPDAASARDAGGAPAASSSCQLVLLRADGAPDRIVVVTTASAFAVPTSVGEPPSPERAVQLQGADGVLSWAVGSAFRSDDALAASAPTTCTTTRAEMAFSTSSRSAGALSRLVPGADGCVDVELDDATGVPAHTFVCGVPLEMFPFASGEALDVTADAAHLAIRSGAGSTLELASSPTGSTSVGATRTGTTDLERCHGERVACGAFVVPLGVTLTPATPLAPGEDPRGVVTHTDGAAVTRMLVGRAEHVLLAMPGCPGGRDLPGAHTQLAVAADRP